MDIIYTMYMYMYTRNDNDIVCIKAHVSYESIM